MNFQRLYEDDALEEEIYDIVCKGQDHIEAIRENNYYPYHYFLSPIRHNLFQWYPFKKRGKLTGNRCWLWPINLIICKKD